MELYYLLLSILSLFILIFWIDMAIKLYKRNGGDGVLIFFIHGLVAFFMVAIIWYLMIWPEFVIEKDYPGQETILFFVVIMLILGVWPFLVGSYFKNKPVEIYEDDELLDSGRLIRTND
ncbi:MAG: hypothetical protein ACI8ZM_004460 [Crocinitomix sp.]|jgi:hypothetical protein